MIGDGAIIGFHAGSPECGTAKQGGQTAQCSEEAAAGDFHELDWARNRLIQQAAGF
jgi:hypothetical protein